MRVIDFLTGFLTSTPPTTSSPSDNADAVSLGYANTNYAKRSSWYDRKANNAAVKAIVSERFDGMVVFNYGTDIMYKWDASSSATDDGINVLTPDDAPGTGRFLAVFQGGGSASTANDFELVVEKINQEHQGDAATPVPNGHFDSFEKARNDWEVRLADSYTSGTSAKIVIHPQYLEDADPSTDSATNWTAGDSGSNLTTSASGNIGTNWLRFDKVAGTVNAHIYIDPVAKSFVYNKNLYFWTDVVSTTNLTAITVEIAAETAFTNYSRWELTTTESGASVTASTGEKFMKLDLSSAPTSTGGAGWDPDGDSVARFRAGVLTSAAGQTYSAWGFDGFMFGDSTGLLYKKGEILTMYNTSTRDTLQVDSASTNVQGSVTLSAGMASAYTASNGATDAKAVRTTMTIEGDGRAMPTTGLSGTIINTQETRISRFLPASLSGATICAYVPFDTKKGLRVTAVNAGVSIEVDDPGNNSALLLNTHTARLVQVIGSDDREDYVPRGTQYTLDGNASHSSGTTTIPLAATTDIEVGDIFLREQITPRVSLVSTTANENLQSMTFDSIRVVNDGLTYPGAGSLYSHYRLGGRTLLEASMNLRGPGAKLVQNGTVPKNIAFFNRQFAAGPFSSANYYTVPGSSVALQSDNLGDIVSGSMWVYINATVTGDHTLVANYSAANNGWALRVRSGSSGGVALVTEGTVNGATPALLTNQWVHVAFTLRGETGAVDLYSNASLTTFTQGASTYGATSVTIGEALTTTPFNIGYIADVVLWDGYALTQTDVSKLYNNGVHRKLGSFDAYALKYEKTGMSGQKLTFESAVNRPTDAEDLYFRGLAALEC